MATYFRLFFWLLPITLTLIEGQTDSDNDPLINYQCMNDQVLIVHSKTADYIKMHCGKPNICGETKKCALSNVNGGQCTNKGNYLQGVFENYDKSVNANCCNYVPGSSLHISDRCTAQEIYDRPEHITPTTPSNNPLATNTVPNNDPYFIVNELGATAAGDDPTTTEDSHFIINDVTPSTTEDPHFIINDVKPGPQVQASLDPKLLHALTDYMRKHDPNFQWSDLLLKNNKDDQQYRRLKRAVLGFGSEKPLFLGNMDAYIASYTAPPYGHADIKLYKLNDTQKPFEVVKAIEKIPHGYRVTSCEVICAPPADFTKSATQTIKRRCRRTTTGPPITTAGTTVEYDDDGCVIIRSTASPSPTTSTSTPTPSTTPTTTTSSTTTTTTTTTTRRPCRRTTTANSHLATTTEKFDDDGCVIVVETNGATSSSSSTTSSSTTSTSTTTTPTTTTRTTTTPMTTTKTTTTSKTSTSTTTKTTTKPTTTSTSTSTSTTAIKRSTLRDTITGGGCRLISLGAAAKMRELLHAGKLLHQTPIPGYKQPGRFCKGAIDKGCLEKCLQVLETRFKNAHCQASTGNCICDQDQNSSNFEQNLRLHHFDPYDPKCCHSGGGGTKSTSGMADPSKKVTPRPERWTTTPPACFSAESLVETRKRGLVKMIDLKVNEEVRTLSSEDGTVAYEPIEWFYHRDVDKKAKFLRIVTENGNVLTLTENHLLPTFDCSRIGRILKTSIADFTDSHSRFARRTKIGDCLLSIDEKSGVLSIDVVKEIQSNLSLTGIFSPITRSGTIIVNNVHASCYSTVENQLLQRSMHNFLIKFSSFVQYAAKAMDPLNIFSCAEHDATMEFDKNIPVMLHYMLKVAKYVLPSNVA